LQWAGSGVGACGRGPSGPSTGHGRERLGASRPGTGLRSVVGWYGARPRFRRAANRPRSATNAVRALLQRPRQGGPETLHRSTVGRGLGPELTPCVSAAKTSLGGIGPCRTRPKRGDPPSGGGPVRWPWRLKGRCGGVGACSWSRRAGGRRPLPPGGREGDRGVGGRSDATVAAAPASEQTGRGQASPSPRRAGRGSRGWGEI